MPRPTGYSRPQIILHWLTVAAVALQLLLSEAMAEAFDAGMESGSFVLTSGALVHVALGLSILMLAAGRWMLRRDRGTPPPPDGEPDALKRVSPLAHLAFYVLLVALPISGAVAWAGQSEAAGGVHGALRVALIALIAAHVGAVVLHQFVWKTGLLRRMLRAED
jgi:cytochrome b561